MAAFVCENPKDKAAFDAHWGKILTSSQITKRTIVADGQVAGHVSCYPDGERLEVTYWLGRESARLTGHAPFRRLWLSLGRSVKSVATRARLDKIAG